MEDNGRTFFALVVFVQLKALKGSAAGDQLVAELGLMIGVVIAAVVAVDFLVGLLCIVCPKR